MSNNDVIQPVYEISPVSEELKDWVVTIEARLNNSTESTEEIPPTRLQIKKIPSIYGNWKCFDDHFQNVPFLPETNMWQFVAFMKRFHNLNVHSYLEELQEKEDDLWSYYEGGSYYEGVDEQFRAENSKRFIEYLLANSCFLIFALVSLSYNWKLSGIFNGSAENDDIEKRTFNEYRKLEKFIQGERVGIQRYMLTMDYQIPWFVVEAVYTKHSNVSIKLNTPIHELVISAFEDISPGVPKSKLHNNSITVPQDGFQHLLHIFHWSRTPEGKFLKRAFPSPKMDSFSIPNATRMQLSATVFEDDDTSGFDVTFNKRTLSGVIQLPPWDEFLHENGIYKNLLAFERGYGMVCGFSVTAYFACIVQLVQTEADITLLQAKYILPRIEDKNDILSSLECYKTVLSFDIPMSDDLSNLMFNVLVHHYTNTSRYYGAFKSKIRKYHEEFMSNYCSSPWITISVVGAILLFVLTFIQTIYSALSYYKQ